MRFKIAVITLITLAVLATAQAQPREQYRYHWTDANGQSHYSDSLTAGAIKYGYDIINESGMVVRHVERTLTPAERLARQKAQRKAAAAQREAHQRELNDQQMLAAYPTLAEYKASQQAQIDNIGQRIHTTTSNLRTQEQNLAELLAKAAEAERNNKTVPKYLTDRIAERRQAVNGQRALEQRQRALKAAAEQQMQANLAHYQELRAKQQRTTDDQD